MASFFYCSGFHSTFVILICCAPASNKIRMVWTCPSRAAMCKGVWPAVVAESGLALCSRSSLTSSLWPIRAAQCRGVWSSCTQTTRRVRSIYRKKSPPQVGFFVKAAVTSSKILNGSKQIQTQTQKNKACLVI